MELKHRTEGRTKTTCRNPQTSKTRRDTAQLFEKVEFKSIKGYRIVAAVALVGDDEVFLGAQDMNALERLWNELWPSSPQKLDRDKVQSLFVMDGRLLDP